MSFCDVIKNIEREPHRNIQDWGILTVGDYMALGQHYANCNGCQEAVERIVEEHAEEIKPKENLN